MDSQMEEMSADRKNKIFDNRLVGRVFRLTETSLVKPKNESIERISKISVEMMSEKKGVKLMDSMSSHRSVAGEMSYEASPRNLAAPPRLLTPKSAAKTFFPMSSNKKQLVTQSKAEVNLDSLKTILQQSFGRKQNRSKLDSATTEGNIRRSEYFGQTSQSRYIEPFQKTGFSINRKASQQANSSKGESKERVDADYSEELGAKKHSNTNSQMVIKTVRGKPVKEYLKHFSKIATIAKALPTEKPLLNPNFSKSYNKLASDCFLNTTNNASLRMPSLTRLVDCSNISAPKDTSIMKGNRMLLRQGSLTFTGAYANTEENLIDVFKNRQSGSQEPSASDHITASNSAALKQIKNIAKYDGNVSINVLYPKEPGARFNIETVVSQNSPEKKRKIQSPPKSLNSSPYVNASEREFLLNCTDLCAELKLLRGDNCDEAAIMGAFLEDMAPDCPIYKSIFKGGRIEFSGVDILANSVKAKLKKPLALSNRLSTVNSNYFTDFSTVNAMAPTGKKDKVWVDFKEVRADDRLAVPKILERLRRISFEGQSGRVVSTVDAIFKRELNLLELEKDVEWKRTRAEDFPYFLNEVEHERVPKPHFKMKEHEKSVQMLKAMQSKCIEELNEMRNKMLDGGERTYNVPDVIRKGSEIVNRVLASKGTGELLDKLEKHRNELEEKAMIRNIHSVNNF